MKRVVSVSIGSSVRDKSVEAVFLGEKYLIERIGTNGDVKKAIAIIGELDGKVDAFGMGGIDLYLGVGSGKKYILREALPIMKTAVHTPIVDGSGMKMTLEKKAVEYINDNGIVDFKNKKVLVTSAIDRFRMTEAFVNCGGDVIMGDLIFALGIPIPIKKLSTLKMIANILMPIISRLPFEMLYPTGEKQNQQVTTKYSKYYEMADIISGDFHYVKKYMPLDMSNKIIVTNTVTGEDVELLRKRNAKMLITTTPEMDGRSFGTNVMEALIVSASGKRPEELTEEEYYVLIDKLDLKPRVEYLN